MDGRVDRGSRRGSGQRANAGADRSARASRFAAWKTGLRGCLTMTASAGVIRAPVKHRFSNEAKWQPETKLRRSRSEPLRARLIPALITPLKVDPTRPARAGELP